MVYHGLRERVGLDSALFPGRRAHSKMIAMRTSMRAGVVGLGLLTLTGASSAQEGKLDEVRGEVRDEEDEDDDDSWNGDEDDDWASFLFGDVCYDSFDALLLFPFRGPRALLGDATFERATFQRYPGREGSGYWYTGEDADTGSKLSLRPRVEFGSDFDDLERTAFGLELEHASRFGLALEWARWREDLGAGGTDELDLGELDVVYRFAQARSAAFWSGVGLNVLDDELETDYGVNFTYGATFLAAPLTLGFDSDLGTLGDATLTHLGFSAGFVLDRFELFAGYDNWDIDSARLTSWSLGLRGWF